MRGNYVKMLFVDYRLAFNAIIFFHAHQEPEGPEFQSVLLSVDRQFPDWQTTGSKDGQTHCISPSITLSPGDPQGCVLSPLLYSLYTYTINSTSINKNLDDTVALITKRNETAYTEEIRRMQNVHFCDSYSSSTQPGSRMTTTRCTG